MWENLADPIITRRGEVGQPKLYAEIPDVQCAGGAYHCVASWMGFRFLDVRVDATDPPGPLSPAQPVLEGTLMLKYLPRTGAWGETEVSQVTFTPLTTPDLTVEWRKSATGTVAFHRAAWADLPTMYHVVNALADLPVLEARNASIASTRGGKSYRDTVIEIRGHGAPGLLDPLTRELVYITVSFANSCSYCVHSHTAAARAKGLSEAQHAEFLAVVAMAMQTNAIATALQTPIDPAFNVESQA
jgi:AhpD family alkylhydroperoxidase